MEERVLGDFGAPKVDRLVVSDPEGEMSATEYNRLAEDAAQLTRPAIRAIVRFTAVLGGAVVYPAATVSHWSVWGSGATTKPTVEKTAQGRYTITYAASFLDALNVVEITNFQGASVSVMTSDPVDDIQGRPVTVTANVVTICTQNGVIGLADIGDNSAELMQMMVWIR